MSTGAVLGDAWQVYRSRRIVRGDESSLGEQTWNVLGVVVLTY